MQKKIQEKNFFYPGVTVMFIVATVTLGWIYLVNSTTIGTDIETVNYLGTGTSTFATTTIGTNFYVDEVGNASTTGYLFLADASTTGTFIVGGASTLTGDVTMSGNAAIAGTTTLATTTIGTNFYVDEAGNASTTANLLIGSGTAITKIMWGTVAINPDPIATSTTGIASSTVTGLTTDMVCVVQPPDILNDDLIPKGATTTEANKLGVYLYNPDQSSGGADIDDGSLTWGYFCIK